MSTKKVLNATRTPTRLALETAIAEHTAEADKLRRLREGVDRIVAAEHSLKVDAKFASVVALKNAHSARVDAWVAAGAHESEKPTLDTAALRRLEDAHAEASADREGFRITRERLGREVLAQQDAVRAAATREKSARLAVIVEEGDAEFARLLASMAETLRIGARVVGLRTSLIANVADSPEARAASGRLMSRIAELPRSGAVFGLIAWLGSGTLSTADEKTARDVAVATTAWSQLADLLSANPRATLDAVLGGDEIDKAA